MHLFEHYCTPLEYIFPQKHCINTKVTFKTHCDGLGVCCQSKEKELSKPSSMSNPETGQQTGTQTTLTPFPCWNSKSLESWSSHEFSLQKLQAHQVVSTSHSCHCCRMRYLRSAYLSTYLSQDVKIHGGSCATGESS